MNEIMKNNINKFPKDSLFELIEEKFDYLQSNFSTTDFSKIRLIPKGKL